MISEFLEKSSSLESDRIAVEQKISQLEKENFIDHDQYSFVLKLLGKKEDNFDASLIVQNMFGKIREDQSKIDEIWTKTCREILNSGESKYIHCRSFLKRLFDLGDDYSESDFSKTVLIFLKWLVYEQSSDLANDKAILEILSTNQNLIFKSFTGSGSKPFRKELQNAFDEIWCKNCRDCNYKLYVILFPVKMHFDERNVVRELKTLKLNPKLINEALIWNSKISSQISKQISSHEKTLLQFLYTLSRKIKIQEDAENLYPCLPFDYYADLSECSERLRFFRFYQLANNSLDDKIANKISNLINEIADLSDMDFKTTICPIIDDLFKLLEIICNKVEIFQKENNKNYLKLLEKRIVLILFDQIFSAKISSKIISKIESFEAKNLIDKSSTAYSIFLWVKYMNDNSQINSAKIEYIFDSLFYNTNFTTQMQSEAFSILFGLLKTFDGLFFNVQSLTKTQFESAVKTFIETKVIFWMVLDSTIVLTMCILELLDVPRHKRVGACHAVC